MYGKIRYFYATDDYHPLQHIQVKSLTAIPNSVILSFLCVMQQCSSVQSLYLVQQHWAWSRINNQINKQMVRLQEQQLKGCTKKDLNDMMLYVQDVCQILLFLK